MNMFHALHDHADVDNRVGSSFCYGHIDGRCTCVAPCSGPFGCGSMGLCLTVKMRACLSLPRPLSETLRMFVCMSVPMSKSMWLLGTCLWTGTGSCWPTLEEGGIYTCDPGCMDLVGKIGIENK
jgi:hypothetical protein